jgi:outer membrane protein assembly factor BamB
MEDLEMRKNYYFAILMGSLLLLGLSQMTYALYQGSDPWPVWRYDHTHSAHTTSAVTDRNITIWNSANYYAQTTPIVVDGKVIFGGTGPRMYALDETTGVELWRSPFLVGALTGDPAFSDGKVFVGTQSGYLYCINASTGAKIWENQLTSSGQIQSAPTVANGKVFVTTTDGYLFGCDVVTSQYGVWYYQASGSIYSSPAVSGNMIYFGCDDGKVYALDTSDPGGFVLIWRFPTGGGNIRSSPCVAAGKVFIGSANDHSLFALNATTTSFNGQLIWKYTLDITYGAVLSSPAYYNGVVYFTGYSGKVYAVNANTTPGNYTENQPGCKLWSSSIGDYRAYSYSVAVTNDKVVATNGAQSVYCLNSTNGQAIWSSLFANAPNAPIVADGNVFVNDPYYVHCIGDYFPPVTYYYTVTPPGAGGESFDIKLVIANATPSQTINTQLLMSLLKINYTVTGIDGTMGMSNITLPNRMLGGPYTVRVMGGLVPSPEVVDDGTHTSIYFTYGQSINEIEIKGTTVVSELSPMIVLASLMIASAAIALLAKSTRIRKNCI